MNDSNTVYTPIFADNRVYHLGPLEPANSVDGKQALILPGIQKADNPVTANQPLSIVMRSVQLPAKTKDNQMSDVADYAVILDVGTAADGSTQSIVVWYQRGVRADQSLNFSNLLVYYEPRWDERVAPFFRVRVMDITKERNQETRRALDRVQSAASIIGTFAANPAVSPLIGIAFTAADLVLANQANRMVLDYSVQLYSATALDQSGSGGLGELERGSYIVVGRPNDQPRSFWAKKFFFQPVSQELVVDDQPVNVPTALITVGTFSSVVPKAVLERSTALTQLLASNPGSTPVEQISADSSRLDASVQSFALAEELIRYRSFNTVPKIMDFLKNSQVTAQLGSDDLFYLLGSLSDCLAPDTPFSDVAAVKTYLSSHNPTACAAKK